MPTVRRRGDAYQAMVRIKRDGGLVHSESRSFESEKLAVAWGRKVEDDIAKNGVPARTQKSWNLGKLIKQYGEVRAQAKPMRRAMECELEQLERELGSMALNDSELTSAKFVAWARKRNADGAGPATVLHNLATMRAILNAAKPMFGLSVDGKAVSEAIAALSKVGLVAPGLERSRRASDDELRRMVDDSLRVFAFPSAFIPMHLIIPLAVALPRRVGELCAMRWEDYNASTKVITLRDTKHPTRPREERVPVPPAAQRILADLPKLDERVLPYNSESVSAAFDRTAARLGIEDLHFHDLRHEGICRLFEMGLQIQEVCLISGHLSWKTLKRYTHLQPGDVVEKMGRLNAGARQIEVAGS